MEKKRDLLWMVLGISVPEEPVKKELNHSCHDNIWCRWHLGHWSNPHFPTHRTRMRHWRRIFYASCKSRWWQHGSIKMMACHHPTTSLRIAAAFFHIGKSQLHSGVSEDSFTITKVKDVVPFIYFVYYLQFTRCFLILNTMLICLINCARIAW